MEYPFKYPEVYAELARQGKNKTALARQLGITMAGLRYKQSVGDFTGSEMSITSKFLKKPVVDLFGLNDDQAS